MLLEFIIKLNIVFLEVWVSYFGLLFRVVLFLFGSAVWVFLGVFVGR